MGSIKAVTPEGFGAQVAGAVGAPILAGLVPGLDRLGPLAPVLVGGVAAMTGSGMIRKAGQGAVLVGSAALAANLLQGGFGGGGGDDF